MKKFHAQTAQMCSDRRAAAIGQSRFGISHSFLQENELINTRMLTLHTVSFFQICFTVKTFVCFCLFEIGFTISNKVKQFVWEVLESNLGTTFHLLLLGFQNPSQLEVSWELAGRQLEVSWESAGSHLGVSTLFQSDRYCPTTNTIQANLYKSRGSGYPVDPSV